MIKMDSSVSKYLLECFGENCDTTSKKRVYHEIQKICNDVGLKISDTDERKYIYKIVDEVKDPGVGCLNELLEAIKKTFTGCEITLGSSEDYISIDWS